MKVSRHVLGDPEFLPPVSNYVPVRGLLQEGNKKVCVKQCAHGRFIGPRGLGLEESPQAGVTLLATVRKDKSMRRTARGRFWVGDLGIPLSGHQPRTHAE